VQASNIKYDIPHFSEVNRSLVQKLLSARKIHTRLEVRFVESPKTSPHKYQKNQICQYEKHHINQYNLNTILKLGTSSGAGTAYPSAAPNYIPGFCGFVLVNLYFSV